MSVYESAGIESGDTTAESVDTCAICGDVCEPTDHTVHVRDGVGRVVTASAQICLTCVEGIE